MSSCQGTSNYILHLHHIDRINSFLHICPDQTHLPSPFAIEYVALRAHVTVRVPAMPAPYKDYTRHTHQLKLIAHHYKELQDDPYGVRFTDVQINSNESAAHTTQIFEVPIATVRSLSIIYTIHSTNDWRLDDDPHPASATRIQCTAVDLHPPQQLSIVPESDRQAFQMPPVFGEMPCNLQLIQDTAANTIEFQLSCEDRPATPYQCDALCVRLTTSITHQSDWMPLNKPIPVNTLINHLLTTGEDKLYILRNFDMMTVPRVPYELHLQSSSAALLADQYGQMIDEQRFEKDVTLVVGAQGVQVHVFRAQLTSESALMRRMLFAAQEQEGKSDHHVDGGICIQLPDEDPTLWQLWAAFLYTGRVEAQGDQALALLSWAVGYELIQLQRACAMTIVRDTGGTGDWLQTVWTVAQQYECMELQHVLNADTAEQAVERYRWLMDEGEMAGATAPLIMRNMFRQLRLQYADRLRATEAGTIGENEALGIVRFRLADRWFIAHDFVLSVRAPLFVERLRMMAECRNKGVYMTSETAEGKLRCPDCSPADMEQLLGHIYEGAMPSLTTFPMQTWLLAKFFGLSELAEEAETIVIMKLMEQEICPTILSHLTQSMPGAKALLRYTSQWVSRPKLGLVSMADYWRPATASSGEDEEMNSSMENAANDADSENETDSEMDVMTDEDTPTEAEALSTDTATEVEDSEQPELIAVDEAVEVWLEVQAAAAMPEAVETGADSDISSDFVNSSCDLNVTDGDDCSEEKKVVTPDAVQQAVNMLNKVWLEVTGRLAPIEGSVLATVSKEYVFLSQAEL